MRVLAFLILGGFAWMGLRGDATPAAFAIGAGLALVMGAVVGGLHRDAEGRSIWLGRIRGGARLLVGFPVEVVLANLHQLRIVLAPRIEITPRWVHSRTALETPGLRAMLGVMISMTPGTITCEEGGPDGRTVWIHALDARTDAEVTERIRARLEAPLRALEAR